jgi:hypothetical protein
MTINLTFVILFFICLITMWLGAIFSFVWNKMLTRRLAVLSLLVCVALALMMAGILAAVIGGMGMTLEATI